MSRDRVRILLLAPLCDASSVGEQRHIHRWVRGVSERADATVLTYRLRTGMPIGPQLPGVRVKEWLDLPFAQHWERLNAAAKPGYFLFYGRARRWIRAALRRGETWDLAHQIGPFAMRYPCPARGLVRPLVIGPLGGSLREPASFRQEMATEPWFMRLRVFDRLRFRFDPWLRGSYERADALIGVAPYVEDLLRSGRIDVRRFVAMSEIGVEELPPAAPRRAREPGDLRLLFVGRVVRTKGLRDAIRALGRLADMPRVTLDVVGDGFDRAACVREASELGVADRVRFHGRLPRDEVDAHYARSDVFLFPSFREPSGTVVIEAMSHGLPMIVADCGGPAHVVDDACGVRVPVESPDAFADGIAAAIRRMAFDPEWCLSLSRGVRARVEGLMLWETKIDILMALYEQLLVGGAPKPDASALASRGAHGLRSVDQESDVCPLRMDHADDARSTA